MAVTFKRTREGRYEVFRAENGEKLGEIYFDLARWAYIDGSNHRYWSRKEAAEDLESGRWTRFVHIEQESDVAETELDRVFRKIRAMMNVHGRTPEEAALFSAKAQELMFRYNINPDQLRPQEATGTKYDHSKYDLNSWQPWVRQLIHNICQVSFVRDIGLQDHQGKVTKVGLVGQKHNVTFVAWMFEYLKAEIERLADEAYITSGEYRNKTFKPSFSAGAVNAVWKTLKDAYEVQKASLDENTTAMVLVTGKDLQKKFEELYPNVTSSRSNATIDRYAYASGHAAGQRINVSRPVSNTRSGQVALR